MKKAYILSVDDEIMNQSVIEETLSEIYEIVCIDNGYDALESIKQRKPDLILLDIKMPGKSGYDVCIEIREDDQNKDIPIIFLTAIASKSERDYAFTLGCDDYLSKPFEIHQLEQIVEQQLIKKSKK